jgi:hypothetical protein
MGLEQILPKEVMLTKAALSAHNVEPAKGGKVH